MTKLRVSEIYLSIQGEGPRVGAPTVFIRFAGCNLRCPGWPCDTPHAIDPQIFRVDAELLTPEEIVEQVDKVAPGGANICYTGGEPFLQNHISFLAVVEALSKVGFSYQEVFTNGTLEYPKWAYEWLLFVLDWKLLGSGEGTLLEEVDTARSRNVERLSSGDVVKFTIMDRADYEEAKRWYPVLHDLNPKIEFIYGVVWGSLEASEVIKWVLEDQLVEWTYSHQLHNVIWDRSKRGI